MRATDYKNREVFESAFETAVEIFEISKGFPPEERHSLTDPIRRSTRSASANIAEAWRKRRYRAAFVSDLSDADTEAAETEAHLQFAQRSGYLAMPDFDRLRDRYDHICRQLTLTMADADNWCASSDRLREEAPDYVMDACDAPTLHDHA